MYIVTMIDVNKIRSLAVIDSLKKTLNEFLTFDRAELLAVYTADHCGEEDLDADMESATELLSKLDHRSKSLGRHLAKGEKTETQSERLPELSGDDENI